VALSGQSWHRNILSVIGCTADKLGQLALPASAAIDAVDGASSAASKCYRVVALKRKRMKEVRPGNDDGV